ncbi:hypothetical protein [Marisediminicola senii]|uniref:hypothetical protein n=1 Tax=Marisediminicola senii TaxID=2711233 RepID=UPI0013ECA9C9|nr:hypothetical protein [Marisediminicola senii]
MRPHSMFTPMLVLTLLLLGGFGLFGGAVWGWAGLRPEHAPRIIAAAPTWRHRGKA